MMQLSEIKSLRPWQLAVDFAGLRRGLIADSFTATYGPYSIGADFLVKVRDGFVQRMEEGTDPADIPEPEIIGEALPVATRDCWAAFVELGAYHVDFRDDPDEPALNDGELSGLAWLVLWQIGETMIENLLAASALTLDVR